MAEYGITSNICRKKILFSRFFNKNNKRTLTGLSIY